MSTPTFDPARMAALRRCLGVSRQQLAEHLGLHATTLARWENGQAVPKLNDAYRLARALGVELRELTDYSANKWPFRASVLDEEADR